MLRRQGAYARAGDLAEATLAIGWFPILESERGPLSCRDSASG